MPTDKPTAPIGVYVAGGASERLTVVRPLIDRLLAAGVVITHDWTRCEGWDMPALSVTYRQRFALQDLDGVRRAGLVWYVAPSTKSEGSAAELGAALALRIPVVVSGPADALGRIFPALAGVHFRAHGDALAAVIRAAR